MLKIISRLEDYSLYSLYFYSMDYIEEFYIYNKYINEESFE